VDAGFIDLDILLTRIRQAQSKVYFLLLSSTLSKRLQDAETELAGLPAHSPVVRMDDFLKRLPEAVARFKQMAAKLGDAPIDVERGRALLKGLLGPIWISPRDGDLVAKMGLELQPLSVSSIRGSGGPLLIHLPTSTRWLRASLTS
jgi:hypothetical protein